MKEKIMKIFLESKIKIISQKNLEKYISFCLEKNQKKHTKFLTARHHILPKAKSLPFEKFKDLNEHQWNGTYLSHKNHYLAHYILTQSIEEFSIYYSFNIMNKSDIKKKKLKEEDLISPEEYDKIVSKTLKLQGSFLSKKFMEEKTDSNGDKTTIAKERGKIYSKIAKETGCAKIGAINAAKTLRNKYVLDKDGNKVSKRKERNKKVSETLMKEIFINGEKTTLAKEIGKKQRITKIKKAKKYKLFHIKKGVIKESISSIELKEIHYSILDKTKSDYLGKSKIVKKRLTKLNKEDLIGLYVEAI